jgi:hypothetical protein
VAETTTLVRWPEAADVLAVDTREVPDLIATTELVPIRPPDDLYVRRDQIEALRDSRRVDPY